jgi:hypothetical protein
MNKENINPRANEFMHSLHKAAKANQIDKISQLIDGYASSVDLDTSLEALTEDRYLEVSRDQAQKNQGLAFRNVMTGLVLLVSVLTTIYFAYRPSALSPKEPPQALSFLYAMAPIEDPTPMLVTPVATITPVPPTPIPPTPVPTMPTATSVPVDSAFLLPPDQLGNIWPVLPVAPTNVWLFSGNQALLNPATDKWQDFVPSLDGGNGGPYKNITAASAWAVWQMEQPVNRGGLYAVYMLSPIRQGDGEVRLSVRAGDQEIFPEVGASVRLVSRPKMRDSKDGEMWLLLGVYRLEAAQALTLEVTATASVDINIGMEWLALIQLNETDAGIVDALPKGRPAVEFIDDTDTQLLTFDGSTFVVSRGISEWTQMERGAVYGGKAHQLVDSFPGNVSITWNGSSPQPAGVYEVQVWIPPDAANANDLTYTMLVNGVEQPSDSGTNGKIKQNNEGGWVSLGLWTIVEDNVILSVSLVMKPVKGEACTLDAVAILRAQ